MTRYSIDDGIPTLTVALSEHMNASELKKLAALTGGAVPTRNIRTARTTVERQHAFLESILLGVGDEFPQRRRLGEPSDHVRPLGRRLGFRGAGA